jgi:hypothetical protein
MRSAGEQVLKIFLKVQGLRAQTCQDVEEAMIRQKESKQSMVPASIDYSKARKSR